MIFVTVGTHEQAFNRLVEEVDELKKNKIIQEKVVIQSGYCTYEAKNCECKKIISYDEMIKYIKEARIVITHGGPATFMLPLQFGKTPIVVPRQYEFGEHVNNHQLEFAKNIEARNKNIIVVCNIKDLKNKIIDYDKITQITERKNNLNNEKFCEKLEKIIEEVLN